MLRIFYASNKPQIKHNRIVLYKVQNEQEIKWYLNWQQRDVLRGTQIKKYVRNYIFINEHVAKLKTVDNFEDYSVIYDEREVLSAIYQYVYVGSKKTIVFYHDFRDRNYAYKKTRDPRNVQYVRVSVTGNTLDDFDKNMPMYYYVKNREIYMCSELTRTFKQVWTIRPCPKYEFEIYELLGEEANNSSSLVNRSFDEYDMLYK